MKRFHLAPIGTLALICGMIFAGAAPAKPPTTQSAPPATTRAPEHLTLAVLLVVDTNPREYIFSLNNVLACKSLASLEHVISDLPADSTITWAPSDSTLGDEPLRTNREREALLKFCLVHHVKLKIIPGG